VILFRRYSFEDDRMLWGKCGEQTHAQLKAMLLQSLLEEPDRTVRQKIPHVVSVLWNEINGMIL